MNASITSLIVGVLVCPLVSTGVMAQAGDLGGLPDLECSFTRTVDVEWSSDRALPTIENQAMAFSFRGIASGGGRMVGNTGEGPVAVLEAPEAVHFLEMTPAGFLNATTVFTGEGDNGRFKAVHSRHIALFPEPVVSQRYGFCEVAGAGP